MVICAPCVAVAPAIVPPLATLFGVGATAVVARRSLKGCKTKKKKGKNKGKNKKYKKNKKKKSNKSMVGGRHTVRKRRVSKVKINPNDCCRCVYMKKRKILKKN